MSNTLFKFTPRGRHPLPLPRQGATVLGTDVALGALVVTDSQRVTTRYPLRDAQMRPLPMALTIATTDAGMELQFGEVQYARSGMLVEHFPLHEVGFQFRILELPADEVRDALVKQVGSKVGYLGVLDIGDVGRSSEGYLGILDLRDVGKQRKVVYFFDMMPVILSIEGNDLVAKTLKHEAPDPFGPWYIIS